MKVETTTKTSYHIPVGPIHPALKEPVFFEFEIEWYDNLKSRYRWVSWLQFENLFWVLLILIIFAAFFLKKIRNRRIFREWEKENYIDRED